MSEVEKVPVVERLAYVLREWEESHAGWAQPMVNGSHVDAEGNMLPLVKTPCACSHCEDARTVLEAYDRAGGDAKAERIRY